MTLRSCRTKITLGHEISDLHFTKSKTGMNDYKKCDKTLKKSAEESWRELPITMFTLHPRNYCDVGVVSISKISRYLVSIDRILFI